MEEYGGLNAFVAHEDLKPGTDWKKELTEKISQCDVFVILLTKKFHPARWTEQEVGIAHAFKKTMVPIRFDNTPTTGFMTDYQATKISYPIDKGEIRDLVSVIFTYSKGWQRHIDELIEQLRSAGSFVAANAYATTLFEATSKFTPEQVNNIADAYLKNYELRGGWTSNPNCLKLFQNNWKTVKPELRKQLEEYVQYPIQKSG